MQRNHHKLFTKLRLEALVTHLKGKNYALSLLAAATIWSLARSQATRDILIHANVVPEMLKVLRVRNLTRFETWVFSRGNNCGPSPPSPGNHDSFWIGG